MSGLLKKRVTPPEWKRELREAGIKPPEHHNYLLLSIRDELRRIATALEYQVATRNQSAK